MGNTADDSVREGAWSDGNLGNDSPAKPTAKYKHQRTFFGDAEDSRNVQKSPCKVCGINVVYGTVPN